MNNLLTHPELDDLEAYLLKRLSSRKEQHIEEHLLICDQCNEAAEGLLQEIREVQANLKMAA